MNKTRRENILANPQSFIQTVRYRLDGKGLADNWGELAGHDKIKGSAVLFLLTSLNARERGSFEPCLLLNKRSRHVLQPGDLCCPGGGVERMDTVLSNTLYWPLSPLRKWPAWRHWRSSDRKRAKGLALLMTTALRESWEEMRLNPFKVAFMGPLPVQKLLMFNRQIYPLVGWVPSNQHFVPNWEVERIVSIPLDRLFDPLNYARYRLKYNTNGVEEGRREDYPCFVHRGADGDEILWGATFRITMDFLKLVFGYSIPDLTDAPIIRRQLGSTYLNGSLMASKEPRPKKERRK